jgi:hypothetical protein
MKLIDSARKLEARLSRTFAGAAERVAQRVVQQAPPEPLQVVHAIVDAVEDEVQPAGRGTHVFPFSRVKVSLAAPSREVRARLEAVVDATPSLADRIIGRLRGAGCDPSGVTVKVAYVSQPDSRWSNTAFHLDFLRQPGHLGGESVAVPRIGLDLTVLTGTATANEFSFSLARIDLGRCAEVRDSRNRLIRTNHVAFADGAGGANESVSRRHAHIVYSDSSGEYRVHDDGSAHGTCVLRNSTTMAVPSGSRGIRLQSGDEIVLGEARLRVTITSSDV